MDDKALVADSEDSDIIHSSVFQGKVLNVIADFHVLTPI